MIPLSSRRPEDQQDSGTGSLHVPSDATSPSGPGVLRPSDWAAGEASGRLPDGTGDDEWVPL
jgi:hypothetical protein